MALVALILVTAIWGVTFVQVKDAVEIYPLFAFLAIRFVIASAVLAPFAATRLRGFDRRGLVAGTALGGLLALGYGLQTAGLSRTTVSSTGFITGLCVVLTPVIAYVLFRDRIPAAAWVGVAIATVGLALLTGIDAGSPLGDALVLGGAAAYALQIVLLERYAPHYDPVAFTLVEMLAACLGFTAIALARGELTVPHGWTVWGALIVTGVFASALAFVIQTWAQKRTSATRTTLAFSAEPVFAAFFGYVLAGDRLGALGWSGCALILVGIVISEPAAARVFSTALRRRPANLVDVLRPRPPAVLGMFGAAVGLISIVSALTPSIAARSELVQGVLPPGVPSAARWLALAFGLALVWLAGSLARGKRRAWQLAVVLVAGVAIAHLAKGLDAEEAGASVALLIALVFYRRHFDVPGDPETKPLVLTAAALGSIVAALMLCGSREGLLPEDIIDLVTATATLLAFRSLYLWLRSWRRREHPTTGERALAAKTV